jgi:hypothetical protein
MGSGRGGWVAAAMFAAGVPAVLMLGAHGPATAQPPGGADDGDGAGGDLQQRMERLRAAPNDLATPVDVEDPGTRIRPATEPPDRERAAPPAPINENRPETLPELSGRAAAALVSEPGYRERLEELRRCRGEVAIERRVKPGAVAAGGVLLRWIVERDGLVQDAEVVATAPTDPDVMGCVHRKLAAWQITPPPETPYRVSRRLSFR